MRSVWSVEEGVQAGLAVMLGPNGSYLTKEPVEKPKNASTRSASASSTLWIEVQEIAVANDLSDPSASSSGAASSGAAPPAAFDSGGAALEAQDGEAKDELYAAYDKAVESISVLHRLDASRDRTKRATSRFHLSVIR